MPRSSPNGGVRGFQMTGALCPVFSRKVSFRGDYYIGYANTFRYKHDVNNNSNIDYWCNLREIKKIIIIIIKKTKNTKL